MPCPLVHREECERVREGEEGQGKGAELPSKTKDTQLLRAFCCPAALPKIKARDTPFSFPNQVTEF